MDQQKKYLIIQILHQMKNLLIILHLKNYLLETKIMMKMKLKELLMNFLIIFIKIVIGELIIH